MNLTVFCWKILEFCGLGIFDTANTSFRYLHDRQMRTKSRSTLHRWLERETSELTETTTLYILSRTLVSQTLLSYSFITCADIFETYDILYLRVDFFSIYDY